MVYAANQSHSDSTAEAARMILQSILEKSTRQLYGTRCNSVTFRQSVRESEIELAGRCGKVQAGIVWYVLQIGPTQTERPGLRE